MGLNPRQGKLRYNRSMNPRVRLVVALLSTGLVAYIALGSVLGRVLGDTSYGQLAVFNEVVRLVLDTYVDPVNIDRTMDGAYLGLTEALDGESAYLDDEELKAFQQPVRDSDADIGVVLSRRFGFLAVVSTRPGSPAVKSGVKPGDIIKTIDERHTRPLGVPTGERLLRGAPGSVVKLRLLRAGSDPLEVSVVRERIQAEPPQAKMIEDHTGYLKVGEFSPQTAETLRGEIASLKRDGATSLLVDLRGAAYGSPEDGVKTAELFLSGGVVTRLTGRTVPEKVWNADPSRNAWDLPMTLLVDGGTAGPAEVVAAALLDAGRSPVVGERTFGRAPHQKIVTLPEGALLLTVAKYVSPKGNPIHDKGVEPSVPVNIRDRDEEATDDLILKKGLEVLKGETKTEAKKAA